MGTFVCFPTGADEATPKTTPIDRDVMSTGGSCLLGWSGETMGSQR